MLYTGIPNKFLMPFGQNATGGTIRTIPSSSQRGIVPGAASFNDGFPLETGLPVGAGGTPPSLQDMNGILNNITQWNQWQQAGGPVFYDAAFQTAIGGYPKWTVLASKVTVGNFWVSTVDNNMTNPEPSGNTGWTLMFLASGATLLIFPPQTTWYVNFATGSDTLYDGTTATVSGSHGPWATIQKAVSFISSNYVYWGTIVISVANGTYTVPAGNSCCSFVPSSIANWYIVGNTASPSSCIINASAYGARGFVAYNGACVAIAGFQVTSWYEAFASTQHSSMQVQNVNVVGSGSGSSTGLAAYAGSFLNFNGTLGVSGSFNCVLAASSGGDIWLGYQDVNITYYATVTCTGTPSFSNAFAVANASATIVTTNNTVTTFTGAATGSRYSVASNAVCAVAGAGATYFPGNAAGVLAGGGVYG